MTDLDKLKDPIVDLQERLDEALDALQMLVDKVENGMAKSKETYDLHVRVLKKNGRRK